LDGSDLNTRFNAAIFGSNDHLFGLWLCKVRRAIFSESLVIKLRKLAPGFRSLLISVYLLCIKEM
jgi:hypothetical protein